MVICKCQTVLLVENTNIPEYRGIKRKTITTMFSAIEQVKSNTIIEENHRSDTA